MDEEIWKEVGKILVKREEEDLPIDSESFQDMYFKGFTKEQKTKALAFQRAVLMYDTWRKD